jgi:hypothetical protein
MARRKSITVEVVIYVLILALAAWLRLVQLGASPLSASEASHALAAASITPQASPFWQDGGLVAPSNPVYNNLTALLFQLFGATDGIARLAGALAGTALVLTPILARQRLGPANAIGLSIVFCISPVFITVSRTAGSPIFAALGIVSALLLFVGATSEDSLRGRLPWFAAALGLALATGADAIQGLLTIIVAAAFLLTRKSAYEAFVRTFKQHRIVRYASIMLITWAAAVSGLGFSLVGFSGMSKSVGAWFSGWFTPGRLPGITSVMIVPFYEPLVFIFGMVGIVFAVRNSDRLGRSAAVWFVAALVINVLYVARRPGDLVWVVMPLVFLAAPLLVTLAARLRQRTQWLGFFFLISLIVFLIIYNVMLLNVDVSGLRLSGFLRMIDPKFYPLVVLGICILLALVVVSYALGWDVITAVDVVGAAAALFLGLLTISATWHLNFTGAGARELWYPQSTTKSVYTLKSTVQMISAMNTGRGDALPLQLYEGDSHADVAWAMRDVTKNAEDQGLLAPTLILAPEGAVLSGYYGEYVGQSFRLTERWAWSGFLPDDPLEWWMTREAPLSQESWILFVRADLVPGAAEILSDADVE